MANDNKDLTVDEKSGHHKTTNSDANPLNRFMRPSVVQSNRLASRPRPIPSTDEINVDEIEEEDEESSHGEYKDAELGMSSNNALFREKDYFQQLSGQHEVSPKVAHTKHSSPVMLPSEMVFSRASDGSKRKMSVML